MVPLSTVSSPAIMRSRVVLPQPDGPSSVTNFRLGKCRLTLVSTRTEPNDLLISSIVTCIRRRRSTLDRTGAESGDQVTLQGHKQQGHRDRHQYAGGHQQPPVHVSAFEKQHHADGEREVIKRVEKHPPEQIVV